jgi:predicted chitinase
MINDAQLRQIMPRLPEAKLQLYLPHLNNALQTYAIGTPLRCAAFIAQLAHESGEFRWMEEIWGPTAAQLRYEPPSDLARRLGNTQPGDGARFRGRGPIQITGRFNYGKFGDLLGIDLCANPALASTPAVAFGTAGLFWQRNGLNELADAQRFLDITRRINGGTNGLADREQYYERAKAVLGVADVVAREMPLQRGYEQIAADRASAADAPPPVPRARRKAGVKPRTTVLKSASAKPAPRPPADRKAVATKAATKKARAKRPTAVTKSLRTTKAATKTAPAKKVGAKKVAPKKTVAKRPVPGKTPARKR